MCMKFPSIIISEFLQEFLYTVMAIQKVHPDEAFTPL